jgi:hypothetical protein
MNDELENLRPEVRDALFNVGKRCDAEVFDTLTAELLRLTDDCARLVDCINAQPPTRRSLIDRAERAEAELAALRAKIADAPITQVTRMAAIGGGGYEWAGCRVPDEWNAKRVRLVVEE